jgi:hypothetical protein
VGGLAGETAHTWSDTVYGGTQFWIQLYDDDAATDSPETGLLTISITSENLDVDYSISVTVN